MTCPSLQANIFTQLVLDKWLLYNTITMCPQNTVVADTFVVVVVRLFNTVHSLLISTYLYFSEN